MVSRLCWSSLTYVYSFSFNLISVWCDGFYFWCYAVTVSSRTIQLHGGSGLRMIRSTTMLWGSSLFVCSRIYQTLLRLRETRFVVANSLVTIIWDSYSSGGGGGVDSWSWVPVKFIVWFKFHWHCYQWVQCWQILDVPASCSVCMFREEVSHLQSLILLTSLYFQTAMLQHLIVVRMYNNTILYVLLCWPGWLF